ncbi:LSM domain-containing protein [Fragilaria crotonensis]|nr:LSM domain-containing protein [Fragilaria crotonensis]
MMNVYLQNAVVTDVNGVKRKVKQVYLRGPEIVFIVLPDMLQHAPMFNRSPLTRTKQNSALNTGVSMEVHHLKVLVLRLGKQLQFSGRHKKDDKVVSVAGEDLVEEGTSVEEGDAVILGEVASAAVVLAAHHPQGHRLVHLVNTARDDRAIGSSLKWLALQLPPSQFLPPSNPTPASELVQNRCVADVSVLLPSARHLSQSKGTDTSVLSGSAKGCRVTRGGVLAALANGTYMPLLSTAAASEAASAY